ncbi:hypothetical protein IAU60_003586 [Kwoniella sp. DSM 27419]
MSQTGPPADAKQAQAAALQELEAAQRKKRAIDTSLGFDNYLKPPPTNVNKKKLEVTESDRLFSTSSGTYQQSIAAKQQQEAVMQAYGSKHSSSK